MSETYQIMVCINRDANGIMDGTKTRYRVPNDLLDDFWQSLRDDYMGIEEQYPYVFNENILKDALDSPLKDYFESDTDDQEIKEEDK